MDFNRIKGEAHKIIFPTIDKDNPDLYLSGVTPTIEGYYMDAWGTPLSLSIADTPAEIGSLGLWHLDLTGAENNHDMIIIKISGTGIVNDTITIYNNAIYEQTDDALVDYPVPTDASIVAALLSAQGITGVLQDMLTAVDSEVIRIVRGDAKRLTFSLGTTWDMTGKKAYFCMKKKPTDDNSAAIVNAAITFTDEANAVGYIDLDTTETGTPGIYYGEVEQRATDESDPQTALQFKIEITQDVRQ